jgi:hypothetical protein
MSNKNGPRGEITAVDGDGRPVLIRVFWKRGATYLSLGAHDHLVHPSNLRRERGFAIEATLVYHVSNAAYRAY